MTPRAREAVTPDTFAFSLRRERLCSARRREGRYLLRWNLPAEDPATLWRHYLQLTEVEQAFKELKHEAGHNAAEDAPGRMLGDQRGAPPGAPADV